MTDADDGLDALAELVRTSTASGVARRALLLRTDLLPPPLSGPEHVRTARAALAPLIGADRSQRHDLPRGRVVLSWRGNPARLLEQTMEGLSDLLQANPIGSPSLEELVGLYDLPSQGEALMKAATTGVLVDGAEPDPIVAEPDVSAALRPLATAELDRLEQSLANTDLSRFARRRAISSFTGKIARLAWEERSLSIPELMGTVVPGRDPRADMWLFRRLTRVLDHRMLSLLSDPKELRGAGPFSLTLNVASVLSPAFLRFDAALPLVLRGHVVVSFLPTDIASDAAAFAFARNFAQARSYRVCLRALTASLLPALSLPALDLDYAQLAWSPDFASMPTLPAAGKAQWIMGQPCTQEAVHWGRKQGISLFAIKPTQ